MRNFAVLATVCLLSACVDWPDLGDDQVAQTQSWPQLLPLDDFLDAPAARIDDGDAEQLTARAAGLRARAAILRRPVEDDAAFEALRERMAAF